MVHHICDYLNEKILFFTAFISISMSYFTRKIIHFKYLKKYSLIPEQLTNLK